MDQAPRPPPPVYQPEMIGEALYLAGTRKRRDWTIGEQAVGLILANRVAPGLVDTLAGRFSYPTQKTQRPEVVAARDVSVFTPSTRAAGTHGPFDRESSPVSAQWWLSKHPAAVPVGLGLLALGLVRALRRGA